MFSNFFPDNPAVYEIMWKKIWYSRTGYRWHNLVHALCYTYTLRIHQWDVIHTLPVLCVVQH